MPLLFLIFGASGAFGGEAAGIAKAVNDAKANRECLAEQKRQYRFGNPKEDGELKRFIFST